MNNKVFKYLTERSVGIGNWLETNKTNIKNNSIKAIATILAMGGIASMAGCKNEQLDQNQYTPTKPSTSQSSDKVDAELNTTQKAESVALLYDNIATDMVRRQLLAEGKISEHDEVIGEFVDIAPVKMSDGKYFPYFYTDFNFTPNYPWIENSEDCMGAYPTTFHAKATINGVEQEEVFEFENFGVGLTGLLSIINSDDIKRPPILLTQEHIVGTNIENHPLAEKCLGTFVNSSTTFTRENILSANYDQLLAFELATEEIQSINFDGKLVYTDENEMN